MPEQTYALGNTLRDIVSGLQGIATTQVDQIGGNVRFGIQRPVSELDGSLPEVMEIDLDSLEYVDEGVYLQSTLADDTAIELGDEVQDVTSGFKGIATCRITCLNGCVFYSVQSPVHKKGKFKNMPRPVEIISSKVLDVIGEGVTDWIADLEPTGGPMTIQRRL